MRNMRATRTLPAGAAGKRMPMPGGRVALVVVLPTKFKKLIVNQRNCWAKYAWMPSCSICPSCVSIQSMCASSSCRMDFRISAVP